jgi:hypothetical protein
MQFVRSIKMVFVFCFMALMVGCSSGGSDSSSGPVTQEETGSDSGGGNQGTDEGGSGDGASGSDGDDGGTATRTYLAPDNYATVSDCLPFQGSEVSELKIFFLNIGSVPHFDAIVDDAVADFENISPWNEFSQNMAFYRLDLNDPAALGCDNTGRYSCDDEKVHQAIQAECSIDDVKGVVKIALAEADHFGALGEVTYVTTRPEWVEQSEVIDRLGQMVIHQVGHDFGLADYMHANYRADGLAIQGWDSAIARQWLNLDGPGCPKWCDSFKPVAEYTLSESAECKNFTDRNACASFNRNAEGQCDDVDGDGHPDCCAWTEEGTDDYFESSCTPVSGTEDIGLACAESAGCYYGGAHGNNSWRPVKSAPDSIMFSEHATAFDTVSEEAIRETMRCCASGESTTGACEEYRVKFADFLEDVMEFKDRLGSCGVVPAAG